MSPGRGITDGVGPTGADPLGRRRGPRATHDTPDHSGLYSESNGRQQMVHSIWT